MKYANETIDPRVVQGARQLLEELQTMADDYSTDVRAAIADVTAEPLEEEASRRLFTRILTVLRRAGRHLDPIQERELAEEVRAEAETLLVQRRATTGLQLVERYGLKPRPVVPTPIFNNQPIPMEEGYADVMDLRLWPDNHRVQLHVQEFRERNHRDPDASEFLSLLQGALHLPSVVKKDPFQIQELAESIARRGVERPPVLTWDGLAKDGNRRIAAARYVVESKEFTAEQKERARWVKVWRAPEHTTDDQIEAIMVALNFEPPYKIEWPEYVKGRLVVDRYRTLVRHVTGRVTDAVDKQLQTDVAEMFGVTRGRVERYIKMVQWAEDFEQYHVDERELDPPAVRYKTDKIFQWFYELEAGRGQEKLTRFIEADDQLRTIVYDLMYDVLDSGAQVRNLYKLVGDELGFRRLREAHAAGERDDTGEALQIVNTAIAEAQRNAPTRRVGLEMFLQQAVQRLGGTPPDDWRGVRDTALLRELERVLHGALGAIAGELASRGVGQTDAERG